MSEIPYNTEYICTYKEDSEDMCDDNYRRDFLAVLKLGEWKGDEVTRHCESLLTVLGKDKLFRQLISKSPFYHEEDLLMSFMGMFNYDQLWWIHPCICEILNTGSLSNSTYCKMKDR
jgi:hypothetical protein